MIFTHFLMRRNKLKDDLFNLTHLFKLSGAHLFELNDGISQQRSSHIKIGETTQQRSSRNREEEPERRENRIWKFDKFSFYFVLFYLNAEK